MKIKILFNSSIKNIMTFLVDFNDKNEQFKNYFHIQNENKMNLKNCIYILVNKNFDNVIYLTKILEILNQNTKLVDLIIYCQENIYLKIDISKKYSYNSFEYEFIKESIVFTINYYYYNHNSDELLYLDLSNDPDKYDEQFNIIVIYSFKNIYFKYYMNSFFNKLNKLDVELTKSYISKISNYLNYYYIYHLKNFKSNTSIVEKIRCEEVKILEKNSKSFKHRQEFKLIVNDKSYIFTDKNDLKNNIKILNNLKIDFTIEILNKNEWLILTNVNIQILIMD